jgi:hypothetical protein
VKHTSSNGSKRRPEGVLAEQVRVLAPAVEEIQRAGRAWEDGNKVGINYTM